MFSRVRVLSVIATGVLHIGLAANANAQLIAYYDFNGNANDVSGNNINLNPLGGAGFASSMNTGLGQAGSFDGVDDGFVGSGFVKSTTNDMSVVAWAFHDNTTPNSWATIVKNWGNSAEGQFHFGLLDNNGSLNNFFDGGSSVTDDPNMFSLGSWHHVGFVADSSTSMQTLFLDGIAVHTTFYDGTLAAHSATGLGIGVKPDNTGAGADIGIPGYWNGLIDEVGIYDTVLSQSDMQTIIQNGQNGIALNVPEPVTVALIGLGLVGMGFARKKKQF